MASIAFRWIIKMNIRLAILEVERLGRENLRQLPVDCMLPVPRLGRRVVENSTSRFWPMARQSPEIQFLIPLERPLQEQVNSPRTLMDETAFQSCYAD